MDIRDLVRADGIDPNRKTSKEYACRCPYCGGKDRFIIWPDQGDHGRWWCRQCGRRGDAIQYLRDVRKMRFQDACQYVGKEISLPPSLSGRSISATRRTTPGHWVPRETTPPGDLWQERARRLVEESERFLFSSYSFAQRMLGWLKELRGLTEETIRAHRLGLVPIDRWEGHEQWGLEPVLKDDGTPKKIWIPRGLPIPLCQDGNVLRIRIRRLKADGDPRYYLLRGSDTRAMVLGQDRDVFVVVESGLDAILLFQEVGDLVGVIALGNAQARPDKEVTEALGICKLILVALDGDAAGAKEAWQWWLHHFSHARRWPPIEKDPGEMFQQGIDLRTWIDAGIDYYKGEIAEPERRKNELPSSENGHGTEPQPQALPSLDKAIRGQEYQSSTLASEPLSAAVKEGNIRLGCEGDDKPEPVAVEVVACLARETQTSERLLNCADCPHFSASPGPNPRQAFGRCLKRKRGRYGCATACDAALTDDVGGV